MSAYDLICHNRIREKNFFTGYGYIHGEKTCDQYIHSKFIIRKLIIFKIKEPRIVIDYNRKFQRLFYDVVVPTEYEKGDVFLIQGDGVNQKLIYVVECVDEKEKTVVFHFLRQERDKRYVRDRRVETRSTQYTGNQF